VTPRTPVSILITAAGLSSRFRKTSGNHIKKEFHLLQGEPVLNRTIRTFFNALSDSVYKPTILIITCTPGLSSETSEIVKTLNIPSSSKLLFVEGGNTRQESVRIGLETIEAATTLNTPPKLVLIHDASRPWVSKEIILSTIEVALACGGSAPAISQVDALKSIDSAGLIVGHHDRGHFVGIQTPQTFWFPEILTAHKLAKKHNKICYDDTEIFTDWGGRVKTIPGDPLNRKITFYSDITASDIRGAKN
jgi:2-C-methyl-D-erythritol 4-phosphate cytidylyltransferase